MGSFNESAKKIFVLPHIKVLSFSIFYKIHILITIISGYKSIDFLTILSISYNSDRLIYKLKLFPVGFV